MAVPARLPRHPILVPGCQVLRRDQQTLQVGVGSRQLVTPDLPEVRDLLTGLRDGAELGPLNALHPVAAHLACELHARRLIVDSGPLLRLLGASNAPVEREQRAAAFLEHPDAAQLTRRATLRVHVVARGLPTWARHARMLLGAAGFLLADDETAAPDVALLLCAGPLDRPQADLWMQGEVPHLVLGSDGGEVQLGPFVVPGRTSCLRCIDAFRAEADPQLPLLDAQRRTAATPSGLPEPIAHDLLAIAVGMAVRELTTWSSGAVPLTRDHTIGVDAGFEFPTTSWQIHPGCGCTWQRSLDVG